MTLDDFINRVKLERINYTELSEGSQQAESKHRADTEANGEVEKEICRRFRGSEDTTLKNLDIIFVPIITNNIAYLKSIAPQWKGVKATLRLDDAPLSPIQLAIKCNNAAAVAVLAPMCEADLLVQLLFEAVKHGKTDSACALIAAGADVNLKFGDLTPLMIAVYEGNLAVMKAIIARDGVELDAQLNNGVTALYLAIDKGKTECALALIAAGADVNHKCGDWTPLMKAAYKGNCAVVSAIIKSGRADLDSQRSNGATALYLAIEQGKDDCAIALIEAGADVNCKFGDWTPLMKAAYEGSLAVMKSIIARDGVKLDTQRSNGATALYLAIEQGKTECALALIAAGADVNLKFRDMTPLDKAAQNGNFAIVSKLCESAEGALLASKAFRLARKGGHNDCAMLIARTMMLNHYHYARHWPDRMQNILLEWYTLYDKLGMSCSRDTAKKVMTALAEIDDDNIKCFLANQILHCDLPLNNWTPIC